MLDKYSGSILYFGRNFLTLQPPLEVRANITQTDSGTVSRFRRMDRQHNVRIIVIVAVVGGGG